LLLRRVVVGVISGWFVPRHRGRYSGTECRRVDQWQDGSTHPGLCTFTAYFSVHTSDCYLCQVNGVNGGDCVFTRCVFVRMCVCVYWLLRSGSLTFCRFRLCNICYY